MISSLKVVVMGSMSWELDLLAFHQGTPCTVPLNLFVLVIVTRTTKGVNTSRQHEDVIDFTLNKCGCSLRCNVLIFVIQNYYFTRFVFLRIVVKAINITS